jgi:tetratricopeptide (TPR) repeat protein
MLLPLAVTARNAARGDPVFIASQGGLNLYLGNVRGADGMSASFPDDPGALGYAMVQSAASIASRREGRALRASEVSAYWTKRTLEELRADPGAWMRLTGKKALLFWTRREIPNNHDPALFAEIVPGWGVLPGWGWWAPFGISGALLLAKDAAARFLAAQIGVVFLTSVAFFVAARFRLPAAALLIVLSAGGLVSAVRSYRAGRRRTLGAFLAGAVLLMFATRWNPYRVPDEPWVISYLLVAEAEKNRGELSRALQWIDRALAEEPGLYAGRRAQLDVLRRMGRFAEGRAVAERLVLAEPKDASAHAELGVLRDLTGDSDGALAELDAALRLDPELDAARVHRAVALARRGDVERARGEIEAFLRERPQSAEADRARAVRAAIEDGTLTERNAPAD